MPDPPKRIQRRRTKGWKMPPNTTSVTRPSMWGNPFPTAAEFEVAVMADMANGDAPYWVRSVWVMPDDEPVSLASDWLAPLRGRDLMCWCAETLPDGSPNTGCHGWLLLRLANPGLFCEVPHA